jgi:hypothetical protein
MSSTLPASRVLRSAGVGGFGQQRAEGQHLAKDAGRLGQGQRGGGQQLALTGGQTLVDAVAQLMRQRHHVARLAQIVQHHIGMHGGHGRMGKGAGRLAGFDAGVDPALVKKGSASSAISAKSRHRRPARWPRASGQSTVFGGSVGRGALRSQTCSLSSPSHFAFSR